MEYRCLVISDDFTSGDEFMQNLLGNSQNVRQESEEYEQHKHEYHPYQHHRTLRNVVESREDDYFVHIHDKYNVASKKLVSRRKRENPQQSYLNENKTYALSPVSLTLSHLAPSESISEHVYRERQQEEEKRKTIYEKEEYLEQEEDEENTAMLSSSTTNALETLPTTIFREHNALHVYAQRLTLPSPSMPSVNITLSLALLHEPHLLSRIIHPTYFAEDQRWRYHKYGSDAQISFHSPHALIFLFNPFHVPSLMSLRYVWINALSECRAIDEQIRMEEVKRKMAKSQHYGSSAFQPRTVNYNNGTRLAPTLSTAGSQSMSIWSNNANTSNRLLHQQQKELEKVGKLQWMKNSNITINGNNHIKSHASSALPTILLIAHSFELLRESMESTPLLSLLSPIELYKVNAQIGAVVYSELSYHWEDRIDELKLHIARACVGEYKDYCAASVEQFYFTRQESVSRGVAQLHQMDDMESESESESESNDTESAIALRLSEVNEQPCETWQKEELKSEEEEYLHSRIKAHEERSVRTKNESQEDNNARSRKSTWTWRRHGQTGKVFYVHRPTATSTYERPADYDGKEPPINEPPIIAKGVESKEENKETDDQELTAERKTYKLHLRHKKKKNVKEKSQNIVEQLTEKAAEKEEPTIINKEIIKELQEVIDKLELECAQVRVDIVARQLFVQKHNKLIEQEQQNRYELIKQETTELSEGIMQLLREIETTKEHYRTLISIIVDNKEESQTKDIVNGTLESQKVHKYETHDEEKNKMLTNCSSENVTLEQVEQLTLNLHTLYLNSIQEIDGFTSNIEDTEFASNYCRDHDDDNEIVTSYWHELATLDKRQISCEVAAMSMNAQLSQVEAEKEIEEDKLSTLFSQFMERTKQI